MDNQDKHIKQLFSKHTSNYQIPPQAFAKYNVKRGLRNADGTGVLTGLTSIGEVRGYIMDDGEKIPVDGQLFYRGVDLFDIVQGVQKDGRFGFEEVAFLLLFGMLPTTDMLSEFTAYLAQCRTLPDNFAEDMIMKAPSSDIMNKLARSVLACYSYDPDPDSLDVMNLFRQSCELIARMPVMAAYAYQAKQHYYDKKSLFLHASVPEYSIAENFLHLIRQNNKFTAQEAQILDLMLMIHAEHGGGNNSAFACRVVSSSDTDTYSAIAAAIGSLKGPKHGGANAKVRAMMQCFKQGVSNWENDDEIAAFIEKIFKKEAGDGSGLVYGMGHAVYTLSDPRAELLKQKAAELAREKGREKEYHLYESIERLTPDIFSHMKNDDKRISANVDLYAGFVYEMLDIPPELYTPLFVIARITGWCAHRIEEVISGKKIIRPAYKSLCDRTNYIDINQR